MSEKKFFVVCYMRVVPDEIELLTFEEAKKELENCYVLQPENRYAIETIEKEESNVVS